jgi:arylsulfatase A-like enzyme
MDIFAAQTPAAGRNHHSDATGVIMELGTGYPGYNSLMPKSAGTFAEVLKQNGYSTAWYGKNHNVPDWHSSQAGPFDLWPTDWASNISTAFSAATRANGLQLFVQRHIAARNSGRLRWNPLALFRA